MTSSDVKISVEGIDLWYGAQKTLHNIHMAFHEHQVTALIGPSGCGKSTLLRCLNRTNDLIPDCRIEGRIRLDNEDVLLKKTDVLALRRKVGMVFQKPNPFPFSIFDNIAYGPRMAGVKNRRILENLVITSLKNAALYDELKDRMDDLAVDISGGQQQRLCIARAMAMGPEVLLMDEPCSALDPIATSKIEELVKDIKKEFTVIIVTHNLQQALRISDRTGFMYLGRLEEHGETPILFTAPEKLSTYNYVNGKFG